MIERFRRTRQQANLASIQQQQRSIVRPSSINEAARPGEQMLVSPNAPTPTRARTQRIPVQIRQQQALQAAPAQPQQLSMNEICRQQGIGIYAGSASIPKPNVPMPKPLNMRAPTPTAARLQQTRAPMQPSPRSMNVRVQAPSRSQHIMAHGRPTQAAQPSPMPVRQEHGLTPVQQVGPRAAHGPTRPPLSLLAQFNQQRAIENRQALVGSQLNAVKSNVISAQPHAQSTPQLETAHEMVIVTPASSRPTTSSSKPSAYGDNLTNSVVSGDTAMSSLSSCTSESPGSKTQPMQRTQPTQNNLSYVFDAELCEWRLPNEPKQMATAQPTQPQIEAVTTQSTQSVGVDFGALSVGNVIDVRDDDGKWHEASVQIACHSFVCVHFIALDRDETIYADAWRSGDNQRVAQRNTFTKAKRRRRRRKKNKAPNEAVPELSQAQKRRQRRKAARQN